ncbi:MAG: hypothetical protein AMXMBFR13_47510 [Phycisphaerae bacterium]
MQVHALRPSPPPIARPAAFSAVGLATVVAALHVAVLAGRFSPRCSRNRPMTELVWQAPESVPGEPHHEDDHVPSNPTQSYSAGRLALTFGVALIVLAVQLQVMRIGAALAR